MEPIRITGLTVKQKALMDIIWSIDDIDEINEFIKTLPRADARDCISLMKLVMIEAIDREVQTLADCEQARELLDRIRLTH